MAAVAVVALGLAYFAWTAIVGPVGVPLTSPTPNAGQAATQFGAIGFYVQVTGFVRTPTAAAPQAEKGVIVSMVFRNTSTQQQRVDIQDFSLKSRSGNVVRSTIFEGCSNNIRVDMYPAGMPANTPLRDADGERAGATYRTAICFPDPGAGPLKLIWEPDVAFGPLSEPITIALR